jgi:pilus assembly protein CpaC
MRSQRKRTRRNRLLTQVVLVAAATLALSAVVPAVHAYLAGGRTFGAQPQFENVIPNGRQVVAISAGADDTLSRLEIEAGKSVLVQTDYDIERVAVGNPETAGVVVSGPRMLQVVAKASGDTNILLWDAEGNLVNALDLHVGVIHNQLLAELQRTLRSQNLDADMAGNSIILRGQVYTVEARERAEQVAMAFFEGQAEFGQKDPNVINLIDVSGNHQVMIEVIMAEMNRSLGREFAVNIEAAVQRGLDAYTFSSGAPLAGAAGNLAGSVSKVNGNTSFDIGAVVDAARRRGLAKILAEPTLVARSGQKASFLAGGEVPLLEPSGLGTVSVELHPFGVGVDFLPTVLGPDRIHLEINSEVSEPDDALGINVNDIFVPGFTTRRASTAVELGNGQSFAIAGLIEDKVKSVIEKVPGLGDLPILGQLFTSQEFQRNETELVIIVTPHLVKPLEPGPRPLPTDHYQEPSDWDFYLLGKQEARKKHSHNADQIARHADAGLIGDDGHTVAKEDQ